jgi:hypothetical protein
MARGKDSGRIRLQPADSFDLIRLIARSQSDPRKAVAELVQNSLDAGANHVRVSWFTHQGRRALSVWDDGQGVFPDLDRPAALRTIATTLGRSHKAKLSPAERREQMTLGKYGIGLLGFWSVGERMEIRSRVAGSEFWVLELAEDVRDATVRRRPGGHLPLDPTMTEVVVTRLHPSAEAALKPRRLAAYLAGELRGQLLDRTVELEIIDRVGRGLAQKRRVVRPVKYMGIPLTQLGELTVEGFAAARVELYLVPEAEGRRGMVALACGGGTVLPDIALMDGPEAPRAPWSAGRFEGVIDFPDLTVAPSTRRGFVPDAPAEAFLAALPTLEARLRVILDEEAVRRRVEDEADDAKALRRLFRRLPKSLPHYTLFEVEGPGPGRTPAGPGETMPEVEGEGAGVEAEEFEPAGAGGSPDTDLLYPPGPLAAVEVRPRRSTLAPGGSRALRAVAKDADGRRIDDGVGFEWRLAGPGQLAGDGARAVYRAPDDPGEARVRVLATSGAALAEAEAAINVSEDAVEAGVAAGVPEPRKVEAPAEDWRSRFRGIRWDVNTAHPDWLLVRDDKRRRLAYLAQLFAKEVVLRNFGGEAGGQILERLVQVLTRIGEPARRA